MTEHLSTVSISGFKSIRSLENFELRNLTILLGANGSGKSNLLSFFEMMNALMNDNLEFFVRKAGIDGLLFNGHKVTKAMEFEVMFGERGYRFAIIPDDIDSFFLRNESRYFKSSKYGWWDLSSLGMKSGLVREVAAKARDYQYSKPVYDSVLSWKSYHFHDTASTAGMRHAHDVEECQFLHGDASNIAPFLLHLRENSHGIYCDIVRYCQHVMPYFENFAFVPKKLETKTVVNLSWKARGSAYTMRPSQLSDGSIRFICLATALLQPTPPSTMIIDEPELGLHPDAISFLSELIKVASQRTQLIVATQSPLLISNFTVEDIVVTEYRNGASQFKRLIESDFNVWLEDYSIGELWEKNVIVAGPVHG